MKRIIALAMAAFMITVLAACGTKNDIKPSPDSQESTVYVQFADQTERAKR